MDITALEKKYHNFYSPIAKVLIEGEDLLKKGVEVISTTVDNTLKGADQFTFVINNAFDVKNRELLWLDELLAFGRKVEIKIGYLDKLVLVHVGLITNVKTDFPSGGLPQITVSGYDKSFQMMKDKKSKPVDAKKDSDVVKQIAGNYGLKVSGVENSQLELPRVEQSQESDFQFLTRLAKHNGFEFFILKDTLYFKKPANDEAAVVTLEWGKGLVSFSPEVNLAKQIKKVKFYGWDIKTKKPIVGKASVRDEPGRDLKRKSGGEFLDDVVKGDAVHRERQPVYSKQEADRRAKAKLKEFSEGLVKGRGESIGIPEIFADKNIELKGLGKRFSKTYYIVQTQHSFTTSGYKTTFNIKETTI